MTTIHWDSAPAGVTVAFTGRSGGVSEGAFASLNLGALTADDSEAVPENRRRAVEAAGGDPHDATMAWQVARAEVREVTASPPSGRFLEPGAEPFPKSDGLVTSLRGRPMMLLTADCLPIAIARTDGVAAGGPACGVAGPARRASARRASRGRRRRRGGDGRAGRGPVLLRGGR